MMKYIVALAFLALVYAEPSSEYGKKPKPNKAVVTLSNGVAQGNIYFTETDDGISITGTISGLTQGKHGFHVHAVGDLTNGCTSMLGHFNPKNVTHGAPEDDTRHVGDLGNIIANATGFAEINFSDKTIALSGENNIIGRGVVIHEKEDDLGKVDNEGSRTTGNAGGRIGCGIIGTLNDGSGAERLITSLLPSTLIGVVLLQRFL